MPANRNALIRYRTLDNCLRNHFKKWTLDDLIDACSDALYEYEGIHKGVSKRTVQMDLQTMRSDKLGYNAPIIVEEKKYYKYADPKYSITNIPLTEHDLSRLTEVTQILRQFKGFSHFQDISGMVNRLEDKIHTAKNASEPIIDFEKNEHLKGLEHIDFLYKAIKEKNTLQLKYKSFRARSASDFTFYPYLLKEFRNRWFVLGTIKKRKTTLLLALDRIHEISTSKSEVYVPANFDVYEYFKHVVGVTVNEGLPPEKITLFVDRGNAPYVLTKPIHPSQELLEENKHGIVITVKVQVNFEFEREILGFGPSIKVLAPNSFKRRMSNLITETLHQYNWEIDQNRLQKTKHRIKHQGFDLLEGIYTKKEVDRMKHKIHLFTKAQNGGSLNKSFAIRQLLVKIPELTSLIRNAKLDKIVSAIVPGAKLTKAIYFDKPQNNNWLVSWHQDATINVKERCEISGYTSWVQKEGFYSVNPPIELLHKTLAVRIHLDDSLERNGTLKVIPGTQKKRLSNEEITLLTAHSEPMVCEVKRGGIQLMKPLLLHASSRSTSNHHRRVIHLEFCSEALAKPLQWSEAQEL